MQSARDKEACLNYYNLTRRRASARFREDEEKDRGLDERVSRGRISDAGRGGDQL